ncbi:MAG TPA: nucleoside phosphorylase, partial [Chloroflexota bacterium]
MSWPFDPSEPLVSPHVTLEISRREHGLTPENDVLPVVLVATFQQAAYDRMLERAGAADGAAGHGGSGGTGSRTVGRVDGVPVALARISVGAPAAALVLEVAIARGVRTILVVGSAGSLQRDLPLGSTVVVEGAEREDGTSHHYLPAGEVVTADPALTQLLEDGARARGLTPRRGRSWTIDAPYRETVGAIQRHRSAGVAVVEMEAEAIF